MALPQLVLIPGAWHTPEAFSLIIPKLKSHGYTIHTSQLPSVDADPADPPKDFSKDIAVVRDLVIKAIGNGNDVVVAPHSWAGIVGGSALTGLGKKEREAKGERGGIVRTAYISAFMAPEGVSLMETVQGTIPDWWYVEVSICMRVSFVPPRLCRACEKNTVSRPTRTNRIVLQGIHCICRPSAASIFYSDLPEAQQREWLTKVKTHVFATVQAKATAASWKEIPTHYLLCEDDQAIPAFAQEAMTGMVRDMGGEMEVERIKAGHSPFLSQPDVVVEWLRRVAGETM